jgi:hypothetical protein
MTKNHHTVQRLRDEPDDAFNKRYLRARIDDHHYPVVYRELCQRVDWFRSIGSRGNNSLGINTHDTSW